MTQNSINTILDALDVEALEENEKEEILIELNEVIFRGTLLRLFEMMDIDTRDKYLALVEANVGEEEIETFLRENVPSAGDAFTETVDELADDILTGIGTNH